MTRFLIKVIFAKHINVAIDTVKATSIKFNEEKMLKSKTKSSEKSNLVGRRNKYFQIIDSWLNVVEIKY